MGVYLWKERLPSTYQEVEYIQSSGTQYINTNYNPKTTTEFEIDYYINSYVGQYASPFGTRYAHNDQAYYIGYENNNSYYGFGNNKANTSTVTFSGVGTRKHITYHNNILSNGNKSVTVATNQQPYGNMVIFAENNQGTVKEFADIKLYSFKLREGSTLIRDYIPCYRKSDSVIGLYDLVNNQFYTNAGSGTFTKGSDVNGVELKNAYIGGIYEYSYDFRNKSTSQITTDGWSYSAGNTPSFNSYGVYGGGIRITRNLSLIDARKITITTYGTLNSSASFSGYIAKTVTSQTRDGLSGTSITTEQNKMAMNIYGTSYGYSGFSSGTYTVVGVIDFVAKTWTLSATGKTTQTGTLTDTDVSNIKNNTTKLFAYISGSGSSYGLATISIAVEK